MGAPRSFPRGVGRAWFLSQSQLSEVPLFIFPVRVDFNDQSGNIPLTTLLSAAPGAYRVSTYVRTAAPGDFGYLSLSLSYTDDTGPQTLAMPLNVEFNFEGPVSGSVVVFQAVHGAISFSATQTGGSGGTYNLAVIVEQIL
jgi:hypothetical protein